MPKEPKPQKPEALPLLSLPEGEEDSYRQVNQRAVREIISWVLLFLAAVVTAALIQRFVAEPLRVDGQSMMNTLQNNEFILVSKADYWHSDPERLDVVICRYPERAATYVKRVIALPGDTVEVKNQQVYVNGEPLEEPYIDYPADYDYPPTLMGEDEYFVLGDNRVHSTDSHVIGPLRREAILGRVSLVVYPQVRPVAGSDQR